MKWYPFTPVQVLVLLILAVVIDAFTIIQRPLVPDTVRPFTYLLVGLVLITAYFFYVRPDEPMVLAATLAVILFVLAVIVVIVQDITLVNTLSWRTFFTLAGAIVCPFIIGYIYAKICPGK